VCVADVEGWSGHHRVEWVLRRGKYRGVAVLAQAKHGIEGKHQNSNGEPGNGKKASCVPRGNRFLKEGKKFFNKALKKLH